MVKKGLCLVYIKYKFSRMEPYLKLETAAMKAGAGLGQSWLAERSLQLKFLWSSEREKKD